MGETVSNSSSSCPAPAHIQTQLHPNQTASSPFKTKVSPQNTHRVAIDDFWRTSHHDEIISPGWWVWGGCTPTPFQPITMARTKLQCTLHSWEDRCSPSFFSTMYSVGKPFFIDMKETPRRRISVTSSVNEISTDQLENSRCEKRERRYSALPSPCNSRLIDW